MQRMGSYLIKVMRVVLLILMLFFLLPKVVVVFQIWMSAVQNERVPSGNPLRVDAPSWSKFVFQLFPGEAQEE